MIRLAYDPLSDSQIETLRSWFSLEQIVAGGVGRVWMRLPDGGLLGRWRKEVPNAANVRFFVLVELPQESERLRRLSHYLKTNVEEPWKRRREVVIPWSLGGAGS